MRNGQLPELAEFGTPVSGYKTIKGLLLKLLGRGPGFTDNATVNILPISGHESRGIAMTEAMPGVAAAPFVLNCMAFQRA